MKVVEAQPTRRERINVRRFDFRSISAEIAKSDIVQNNDQYVWALFWLFLCQRTPAKQTRCK